MSKSEEQHKIDGMMNVVTGLGTARDKRSYNKFVYKPQSRTEIQSMYDGSDLATRIVDFPVQEMLREGFEIKIPNEDSSISDDLIGMMEEQGAFDAIEQGLIDGRLFGGAATYVATDRSSDASKPFRYDERYNILFFYSYDRYELYCEEINSKFGDRNYMKPEMYSVQPFSNGLVQATPGDYKVNIHESRLLIWPGERITKANSDKNRHWGASSLSKAETSMANFTSVHDSLASFLQDFAQGIFKLNGLTDMLKANQAGLVAKKMEVIDMVRSIVKSIVIDKEDDFNRESFSLPGYGELIEKVEMRLVQSTNMPRVVLIGDGGEGLGDGSSHQIKLWHQHVHGLQKSRYQPGLERLVKMYFNAANGPTKGKEPENWKIHFKPLGQPSDNETTEMRRKQAETDKIYVESQVLTPDEVRKSRFGGVSYDLETRINNEDSDQSFKDLKGAFDKTAPNTNEGE